MAAIVSVTKVEQVRFALLQDLFSGKLTPGQRIVEARLAQELGVSQATVNAALGDLHAQGIVTKLLNRSTNVSRYSRTDIDQLFMVRTLVEPAAGAEAARRIDQAGLQDLDAHVDAMRRAARSQDLAGFCLADYSFHQSVFRLTRSPFLIQACTAIAAAPFAYILCGRDRTLPTDYLALAEDHRDIVRAIESGPKEAETVIRGMIEEWWRHSIDALSDQTDASRKAG